MKSNQESWEDFEKEMEASNFYGIPVERSIRESGNKSEIEKSCACFGYLNGYSRAENETWRIVKNMYEKITKSKVDPNVEKCADRVDYYYEKLDDYISNHKR